MSNKISSRDMFANENNTTNNEEDGLNYDFCLFSTTDTWATESRNYLNTIKDITSSENSISSAKKRMTLQQKRRSMLQGNSDSSRGFGRKDSGVDLLSAQLSLLEQDNTPAARWKRAFMKLKERQDPWKKLHLHSYPPERVLRHRYNALTKKWKVEESVVKIETKEFNSGAMRSCYRLKKLPKVSTEEKCLSFAKLIKKLAVDQGLRWTSQTRNCVAKKYMDEVERKVYFEDVQLQMDAKLWGEEYNRHHPPKQVDILEMSVLEFTERTSSPLFHLENFIEGNYIKYNSNSGFVESHVRMTPQAFSHFTFERSSHTSLVVDIQGVGDLWTDPQMHTFDGLKYGEGNLGARGMALFFHSHRCNAICKSLGLQVFDLWSEGAEGLEGVGEGELVWEGLLDVGGEGGCGGVGVQDDVADEDVLLMNPETRVRGREEVIEVGSPRWMSLPSTQSHDDDDDDNNDDGYDDDEGIASPLDSTKRSRFLSGSGESSANTLTEEEERRIFQKAVKKGARGSSVLIEMGKFKNIPFNGNSILGMIHHEMAKYHEMGRFSCKGHPIDYKAAVFHEQQASKLGINEASLTLAEMCLFMSRDILSSISYKRPNEPKGVEYMRRAAEQGDRRAMILLAEFLHTGLSQHLDKNYKESIKWFERSMATAMEVMEENGLQCSVDHPSYDLQSRMAQMYMEGGHGLLARDPKKAGDLFSEAAEAAMGCMKGKLASKLYACAEEAYALCEGEEDGGEDGDDGGEKEDGGEGG